MAKKNLKTERLSDGVPWTDREIVLLSKGIQLEETESKCENVGTIFHGIIQQQQNLRNRYRSLMIELLQAENSKKILCFEVEHIGFVRLHYNAPQRSDSRVTFVPPPERSDFHSAN